MQQIRKVFMIDNELQEKINIIQKKVSKKLSTKITEATILRMAVECLYKEYDK